MYPFAYLISVSISDPQLVMRGKIWLLPKKINFESYKYVFKYNGFWQAYYNTIWYTVVGTLIGLVMTLMTAYPLSRKNLKGRKPIMLYLIVTMYFSGGLIPGYLLMRSLNLIDTRWALVIPGAVVVWYLILARTFFEGIPESLTESAQIDGCSQIGIFIKIVLPLSKAIISVIALYFAVDKWNSYFAPLIYLNRDELYPVQVILQKIVISFQSNDILESVRGDQKAALGQGVRYAMIIITILPIVCFYPFIQKYFVKGVLIGSIKG